MSGHDIAHNPLLLTLFLVLTVVVIPVAAVWYARRLQGRPPWWRR